MKKIAYHKRRTRSMYPFYTRICKIFYVVNSRNMVVTKRPIILLQFTNINIFYFRVLSTRVWGALKYLYNWGIRSYGYSLSFKPWKWKRIVLSKCREIIRDTASHPGRSESFITPLRNPQELSFLWRKMAIRKAFGLRFGPFCVRRSVGRQSYIRFWPVTRTFTIIKDL